MPKETVVFETNVVLGLRHESFHVECRLRKRMSGKYLIMTSIRSHRWGKERKIEEIQEYATFTMKLHLSIWSSLAIGNLLIRCFAKESKK